MSTSFHNSSPENILRYLLTESDISLCAPEIISILALADATGGRNLTPRGDMDPKALMCLFTAEDHRSSVHKALPPAWVPNVTILSLETQKALETPDFRFLQQSELTTERLSIVSTAAEMLSEIVNTKCLFIQFVRFVHLLHAKESDIDISFSFPETRFSVFLSIPFKHSVIASLRVAESLLHESLHLELTAIQSMIPTSSENQSTYYSPWTQSERSIDGILHGSFVFAGIHAFLRELQSIYTFEKQELEYVTSRQGEIETQLKQVAPATRSPELTYFGRNLFRRLIKAK